MSFIIRRMSSLSLKTSSSNFQKINLVGRDFTHPRNISAKEMKSLLWTAMDLKFCKQQNAPVNVECMKEARVTLLLDKPCIIMQSALKNAVNMLNLPANVIISDEWNNNSANIEHYGQLLGLYSDIVFCKSFCQSSVETLANGGIIPVVGVETFDFSLIHVLSNLMTLQLKHNHLKGLKFTWIGLYGSLINTYLSVLPQFGINLKYFCFNEKSEQVTPYVMDTAFKLAQQYGTEIHECSSVKQAIYRSDVIATSYHNCENLMIVKEHVDEAAIRWSLLDSVPKGSEVADDVYKHKNSLVFKSLQNIKWIYAALIIRLLKHHDHVIHMPAFDDIEAEYVKYKH